MKRQNLTLTKSVLKSERSARRGEFIARTELLVVDRDLPKPPVFPIRMLQKWVRAATDVPNAASLRPALASLNHRILTYSVIALLALLPPMAQALPGWRAAGLAVDGALCLALIALRSQLRAHIFEQWEITMQRALRSALLPDAVPSRASAQACSSSTAAMPGSIVPGEALAVLFG